MHRGMIEHMIPGRVRLRFREQRRNEGFFQKIAHELAEIPTVERVHVNALTGSVLIFHSGNPTEIAERVDAVAPALPVNDRTLRSAVGRARRIGERMPRPKTLAFCALALFQLARGRIASNAAQQLWYAERANALGHPPLAIGMAALGLAQLFGGRWLGPASSLLMYALMTEAAANGGRKIARSSTAKQMRFARLRWVLPGIRSRPG